MKAFQACVSNAWAITPDALTTILEIAARENPPLEAVEKQLGRPLDNTQMTTQRDGVATIPISGPIFPRGDFFTRISGATSVDALATDFTTALENPRVKAIILDIDSPGGSVTGISEFSDMIHAARGQKPITAYINGLGCSAAYWIASACDEIVANDTSITGSIGVISAVPKNDKASAKEVTFIASQSPHKRSDPETAEGRNQIQTMVDDLCEVFVTTVARNRGVSEDTVLSDFGGGGVMVGRHAVTAGLADRVGSYEGLHAELSQGEHTMPRRTAAKTEATTTEADLETLELAEHAAAVEGDTILVQALSGQIEKIEQNTKAILENGTATTLPLEAAVLAAEPLKGVVLQSDFDALQARLAVLESERAAETEARVEAEARAAELQREKELSELEALARDGGWHGDATEHATFMHDLSEPQREHFVRSMNAYAEQVKAGALFGAVGSTNPTGEFAADPAKELDARAKALAKESHISYEAAFKRVRREDPDLDRAYRGRNTTR